MPLPEGTWNLNLSGELIYLQIGNVSDAGVVSGNIMGYPIEGFWNESSQMLLFEVMRVSSTDGSFVNGGQFLGYLFSTPKVPEPGSDFEWCLSGTLSMPPSTNGLKSLKPNSRRMSFGWFAIKKQVV